MIRIDEYQSPEGDSPFQQWFQSLDPQAATFVTVALDRLARGNRSSVESIGEGASEIRINRGPGYRVYFGWDGLALVLLLGGGTKHRQQKDIDAALVRWRDYKARKSSREMASSGTRK